TTRQSEQGSVIMPWSRGLKLTLHESEATMERLPAREDLSEFQTPIRLGPAGLRQWSRRRSAPFVTITLYENSDSEIGIRPGAAGTSDFGRLCTEYRNR